MTDYSMDTFWNELKSGKFASMVKESSRGQALSCSMDVYNIIKPMTQGHDDVEILYGIFLDRKNKVLSIDELFKGTLTGTAVYPREILKKILQLKAAAIVLAHNHPSGDTTPSFEDKEITVQIALAMHCIGVSLMDHIIVGSSYHSMADEGWIQTVKTRIRDVLTTIRDYSSGD